MTVGGVSAAVADSAAMLAEFSGVFTVGAVAGFVVDFAALPEDFAAGFVPEARVLRVAVGLLGLSAGGFAAGFVAGRVLAVE